MSDPVTEKNTHDDVSDAFKIAELHALVDGIGVAMLVTHAASGLAARPMATQSLDGAEHLWFMTSSESGKVAQIEANPSVNVSYIGGSKEWISVSGAARLVRDRRRIHDLYKPDWKAWFTSEGGDRNGGPDDPRIVLVEIEAHHVTYFKVNEPRPVVLFQIAKAAVTKSIPDLGALRNLDL